MSLSLLTTGSKLRVPLNHTLLYSHPNGTKHSRNLEEEPYDQNRKRDTLVDQRATGSQGPFPTWCVTAITYFKIAYTLAWILQPSRYSIRICVKTVSIDTDVVHHHACVSHLHHHVCASPGLAGSPFITSSVKVSCDLLLTVTLSCSQTSCMHA
jgi:hypothetical protein